ncbi:MAG: tyrosine-type recombinase/integrase [Pseudomonadota bacterium]
MPRPRRWPPTIHTHHSGYDFIRIHEQGRVREIRLGPTGSPEARAAYARVLAELEGGGATKAQQSATKRNNSLTLTVADLAARWLDHALRHYRNDRQEYVNHLAALRPLLRLYAGLPGAEFGPRCLRVVLLAMASGSWLTPEERARSRRPSGWCRRVCNRNLVRLRTMFRWLEAEELVAGGTSARLATVRGLARGEATDRAAVQPAPEADVARALPEMGLAVRALVELQLLTAARPSELLGLRPCDLIREGRLDLGGGLALDAGGVWFHLPGEHKTAHHGRRRVLLFGPRAQAVLAPFLHGRPADRPLFSPRETAAACLLTAGRPVRFARGRKPGDAYRPDSYLRAVQAACRRAGVPPFTPYQLRHNAGTRLVEQWGWDVARIVLGHATVQTTAIYALDDLRKAAEAIRKCG